ncbi:ATP-binding cassette domain-containing protein, partial [Streptomyces oceani]
VDLTVRPGETVALMGRNGAGKSTLLNTLVGLHQPAAGSVRLGPAASGGGTSEPAGTDESVGGERAVAEGTARAGGATTSGDRAGRADPLRPVRRLRARVRRAPVRERTAGSPAAAVAPHRTPPGELLRHVGLVPQEPRDLLHADTVAGECTAADRDAGASSGSCRALVSRLLPDVPDDTHPRDLSEGQRLALALAVILTARPPLLLLDEPTRGLDYAAKARLVDILRELAGEGHAIILATHDVELAAELTQRVVVLAEGEVVANGPAPEVVTASPTFAPQVAKILAPEPWLTVPQVRAALGTDTGAVE